MRCLLFALVPLVSAQNLDQFTYEDTGSYSSSNPIFPPPQWDRVRCGNLDACVGWPDKWEEGQGWSLTENFCQWCPAEGNNCGTHHQSPINLERNRAIAGNPFENECIDIHWMAYYDSGCTFQQLHDFQAFSIERHGLIMHQPIERIPGTSDSYRLRCGGNFGMIDYSKGFSNWWFLSHHRLAVPSEHHQEGYQYSAEIQLYHFYSVSGEVARVDNEMGTLSIFLDVYPNQADWETLNDLICEWRIAEQRTVDDCGIQKWIPTYNPCKNYRRNLRSANATRSSAPAQSVYDILIENHLKGPNATDYKKVLVDQDFTVVEEQEDQVQRRLQYGWNSYFPLIDCRTEYYYRVSGTQTIPPCYGKFVPGDNRKQTNHWRIMKDPVRISKRQLRELHRLIRTRIAPPSDPIRACQPDTAAKDLGNKRVSVARPLQSTHTAHFEVFCECDDWQSKWAEDQQWCTQPKMQRLYQNPYNFASNGFAAP